MNYLVFALTSLVWFYMKYQDGSIVHAADYKKGSVYFTADFLVTTDWMELLCRQSDAI